MNGERLFRAGAGNGLAGRAARPCRPSGCRRWSGTSIRHNAVFAGTFRQTRRQARMTSDRLDDIAKLPLMNKETLPRRLPAGAVLRAIRTDRRDAHVQRLDRHAGGHALYAWRTCTSGASAWPAATAWPGRRQGDVGADHAVVRPVQRRVRLLPRRAGGGAVHHPGRGGQHAAADSAGQRFRHARS